MKKILTLTFALALLVCLYAFVSTPASAATSGNYTYSVSNGEATITDCSTAISGNVTIPSTFGGYPVTAIGNNAFYKCTSLTSVTVPDSVTSISYYAFEDCASLTAINVASNNPAYISVNGVLFNKNKTTLIQYPAGKAGAYTIPNSVTTIGNGAFLDCISLTSVAIPNSVTTISEYSFAYCNSLTSLTIGNGVTTIDIWAFYNCNSLTSVTIPNSVTTIGDCSFRNCDKLTSVTIPNSVTTIGGLAFYDCDSLTKVTIGNSVTTIGDGAFYSCDSLTKVTIGNSVTTIGRAAFSDCDGLTTLTIPDSVTTIGDETFFHCSGLASVTIPDSVTTIGAEAFRACVRLTDLSIGNGITSINAYTFQDCDSLTSVTIPNSVTEINGSAFYDCDMLNTVTLPNGIVTIWPSAFGECQAIKRVYYQGTETDKEWINIGTENTYLEDATWHYVQPVVITVQPESVYVDKVGATAKVTVEAAGDGLTYEWYFMNPGASKFSCTTSFTGNSYSVKMDESRSGRQIYCVVYDRYGNYAVSDVVELVLLLDLKITKEPASVCVANGEKATVKVTAQGVGLTYEWYFMDKGGKEFKYTSSFKTNTYSVEMTDARAGRQVLCLVYDAYGNYVQSEVATLNQAVRITKQPTDVCVANGKTATVKVTAKGDGLTYKWYFKEAGASDYKYTSSFKGNTYSVTMTNARAGRRVLCKVYDKYGNMVKSNSVVLGQPVRITKQPVDVSANYGEKAAVKVTASGVGLRYDWYFKERGGSEFVYTSSFKTNTYSVVMNDARAGRQVLCIVYDAAGNYVQSEVATLHMTGLRITKQPVSVTVSKGSTAKVTVTAQGEGLTYTWFYKNPGKSDFTYTATFTGNSYSVKMDSSRSGRQVCCIITDKYGNTVQSDIVTLKMK